MCDGGRDSLLEAVRSDCYCTIYYSNIEIDRPEFRGGLESFLSRFD